MSGLHEVARGLGSLIGLPFDSLGAHANPLPSQALGAASRNEAFG